MTFGTDVSSIFLRQKDACTSLESSLPFLEDGTLCTFCLLASIVADDLAIGYL